MATSCRSRQIHRNFFRLVCALFISLQLWIQTCFDTIFNGYDRNPCNVLGPSSHIFFDVPLQPVLENSVHLMQLQQIGGHRI